MSGEPTVFIVDDDQAVRSALRFTLQAAGLVCETFATAQDFIEACDPARPGCLVLDVRMPGMSGLDLQQALEEREIELPVIFLTGHGDVPMAVRALKHGAFEFLEKPFDNEVLLERIRSAIRTDAERRRTHQRWQELENRIRSLTPREHQVLEGVVAGLSNKRMANNLHVSVSTVEIARRHMMQRLEVDNISDLVRIMDFHRKHQRN